MRRLELFTILQRNCVGGGAKHWHHFHIVWHNHKIHTLKKLHKLTISFSDSNKIVHLKDVFQNQHEIVLVLEYAPGRCLFLILVFK